MATKRYDASQYAEAVPTTQWDFEPKKLFDITCTIGSVYSSPDGQDPRAVAFQMIAMHGADGHYTFPNEDGSINHVTVETELPK